MTVSFGLGESISVNVIIDLPIIKEWKLVLDVDAKMATSKLFGVHFDLSFQHAANGFSEGIQFKKEDFVRPKRATPSGLALLCQTAEFMKSEDVPTENKDTITIKEGSTSVCVIGNNEE